MGGVSQTGNYLSGVVLGSRNIDYQSKDEIFVGDEVRPVIGSEIMGA